MRIYMLIYLVWIFMFNSWYKLGWGKNLFKNLEFSLWITLTCSIWYQMYVQCLKFSQKVVGPHTLTHWGRVTFICVSKLTIFGSDNGLSPGRRQAIIWTNAGILLIGSLGTNFSEILIEILTFSIKKMHLKISSAKWRPFCLGLNVLNLKS